MDNSDTGPIAAALSQALFPRSWELGGPCGASIIAAIFPAGGLTSYFGEAFEAFDYDWQNKHVDRNDPDPFPNFGPIDQALNIVVVAVQNDYAALKANPAITPRQLNTEISGHADFLYDQVILKLRHPVTVPVYLMAAAMHLALIQEQAITDPDHQSQPNLSPFAQTLRDRANDYLSAATNDWSIVQSFLAACNRSGVDTQGTAYYDQQMGGVETITAQWQALAGAPAVVPGPPVNILSATCVTTRTPSQGSTEIEAWVSWSTIGAVTVLLDQTPAAASGSQRYVAQENECGVVTGAIAPERITATDPYGQ